jgi:hypothetical protein
MVDAGDREARCFLPAFAHAEGSEAVAKRSDLCRASRATPRAPRCRRAQRPSRVRLHLAGHSDSANLNDELAREVAGLAATVGGGELLERDTSA